MNSNSYVPVLTFSHLCEDPNDVLIAVARVVEEHRAVVAVLHGVL